MHGGVFTIFAKSLTQSHPAPRFGRVVRVWRPAVVMWMMEWRVGAVCDICGFDRLGEKLKSRRNELTMCQLDSVTFGYFLP